ncbi:MAG TPA: hypothetical protein DCS28_01300 [Candidatus Moranbacteria bacterium]|nr:hypothetical protein [Candidatus Moranbacteria bacterium]HAT74662.1 hypothetical protein [Candidatus Moranbacteria bacterium]
MIKLRKKMKNNLIKMAIFIKTERRVFFALVFLFLVFLINQGLYTKNKITSQDCMDGKCSALVPEKPQLSRENSFYYIDDLFKNRPSGYYRLTFQEKSNETEKIILKLNTYSEKESFVGELTVNPSGNFQNQEIFFFLPEGFDSLLFAKENSDSDGNIFIKEAGISKLNIESEKELVLLKKTVIGDTKTDLIRESQLSADYIYPWLKESKTILGQIFRSSDEYISAVSFNIDINKNLNPGSRQYVLSLRKVKYDRENASFDGQIIADLAFSAASIEKYRQNDGTFLFPIYGMLEKNAHYLLSLDNSKVSVDKQNYLEFKGSKNNDSYGGGSAIIKKEKNIYIIDGDLYFKIYGAEFHQENGVKILNGAKIEDSGKGMGKYSYAAKGKFIDLLDLEISSPGMGFSEDSKVITAEANDSASFNYTVNTIYPIGKMNFSATQLKAGWKKVSVKYSFNQENWFDMPFSEGIESRIDSIDNMDNSENSDNDSSVDNATDISAETTAQEMIQVFDFDIIPTMKEIKTVYFKITYNPNDESKAHSFALKNLQITADLKMK